MSSYVLLTGSTGLLGRYLIRDLLLAGQRLAVIVRPSRKESGAERIEGIMQMWEAELGQMLPRPICLEGDICSEGLGLDVESRNWVANHCSTMLHSAASLTFHADGSGEPYNSNVGGTQNMLGLCRDTGIRRLHYVSTAYVCGLRSDLALENELDVGQDFRNDYEQTKLEAEKLVRSADFVDELTVYRPAVIAGDSQTGYTNTYHGLYMYLKLIAVLNRNTEPGPDGKRHTPVRLNMTGDEPRNIIPVDWVSAVMCHLLQTPEAHGKTFHIAPEKLLTPREIIEAGYTYFNSYGVEFVGCEFAENGHISDMDRDAHDNMGMYKEYEASDPTFDLTNLHKYAKHLPCPEIDEAMLHRFWKYGEEDRWGKRRAAKSVVEFDVQTFLSELTGVDCSHAAECIDNCVVGLNVIGKAGGQWSLVFDEGAIKEIRTGLTGDCSAVLEFSSDKIKSCETPQAFLTALLGGLSAESHEVGVGSAGAVIPVGSVSMENSQ